MCAEATQLQSKIGRGTIILAVSEVAGYVSDRLEFHHPGSGLSNVRTESCRGKLPRKMDGGQKW